MQSLFFHFTITFVVVCVMEGECEVITGLNRTTERGNVLICNRPGLLVCNLNDCLLSLYLLRRAATHSHLCISMCLYQILCGWYSDGKDHMLKLINVSSYLFYTIPYRLGHALFWVLSQKVILILQSRLGGWFFEDNLFVVILWLQWNSLFL